MANEPTPSAPLDLDAYFRRIEYTGPRTPDLETLRGLVLHHTTHIPFENLNPLMGWPVRLDPDSVQEKLVRQGRGGYCYEQNSLFARVLQALGFRVGFLAARVVWNQPEEVRPARSHMVLRVDLDEQLYLTDVGFGAMTPTAPLRFETGIEQATPHEPYRLQPWENVYLLQAQGGGEWRQLYRIDLVQQFPADYEVYNWYTSTNPNSPFTRSLISARADTGRRHTLVNRELTTYTVGGGREQQTLASAEELRQALQDVFCITLPEVPELETVLRRALDAP